ncbi:MAG: AAA family ATPase [Candidatus Lokiarchaeota archaeon]|nr:AAA family ATPase [Candidatus Lokiarchaeota archaeon]
MILAIGGFHGTGKSTVAKKLAEKLNLEYYSTGEAFRDLAEEFGMNLEEFSKYVEDHPEIDKDLDKKVIEVAKDTDKIVIDSLLSAYLLKDRADCKILLKAPLKTRVKRMVDRDNSGFEEKLEETKSRENSEIQRFIELYDIDLTDKQNRDEVFDLIIDTGTHSVEDVIEKIIEYLENEDIK